MKKRIEKYFPAAVNAIKSELVGKEPIPREYQAYISGFGMSVMQIGLLPTLAIYSDKESLAAQPRKILLEVLKKTLLNTADVHYTSPNTRNLLSENDKSLFDIAIEHNDILKDIKDPLLDAAVAVKLCIRTFELTKL